MKGLLLKDYYTIKDTLLIQLVMLCIIGIGISVVMDPLVFIVVATSTFSLFSSTAIVSDKTSKWDLFSHTIPISPENVIRSKYLLNIMLILLGLLCGILVSVPASTLLGAFHMDLALQYVVLGIAISLASSSISIPLSILLDDKKQILAMIFSMIIPTGFVIATLMIASQFIEVHDNKMLLAVLILTTGLIMFTISWFIAPPILSRRRENA